MKLLFQSDDFGISEAVTLGIVKGIEEGIIRNTGLFTNMKSSKFAAQFISKLPQCCFGVDINLVAGSPVSPADKVPSLVDEDGKFITSISRFENNKLVSTENRLMTFEKDPYVYEEVLIEMQAQVEKYIELVGKKPEYLHPHSLVTPNMQKAFLEIAEKYGIPFSKTVWKDNNIAYVPSDWNIKPVFKVEDQVKTDVAKLTLESLKKIKDKEVVAIVCHAGYVDADLIEASSYSVIRAKDLEMSLSEDLIKYIKDNNIELITYRDLV